MSEQPRQAFPLQWPAGWKRTAPHQRTDAKFRKGTGGWREGSGYRSADRVTVGEGTKRVMQQLRAFGVAERDIIISTDLKYRGDGLPYANQATSKLDPGAAVYWRDGKRDRCMAIDRYRRIEDNLAAIAATLEAMRAIERHGGAEVKDRAFTGFQALPEKGSAEAWHSVLGVRPSCTLDEAKHAWRELVNKWHPDKPYGDRNQFDRVQRAWEDAQQALK